MAIFDEKIEISSRARVALGRELQLPMSFPWPVFPGLDQDLFPPMVFLVFLGFDSKAVQRSAFFSSEDSIQVHYVNLGESFPTSIYLQNLASIQSITSLFNYFNFNPPLVI